MKVEVGDGSRFYKNYQKGGLLGKVPQKLKYTS